MAQITLQEFRAKYPDYDDMSDGQLADALHKKFYSDMPREAFDAKLGLKRTAPAGNWSNIGAETMDEAGLPVIRRSGGALRNFAAGGVEALTGAGAMLSDPGDAEAASFTDTLGLGPRPRLSDLITGNRPGWPKLPSTQPLNSALERATGFNPENVQAVTSIDHLARAAGFGAAATASPQLGFSRGVPLITALLRTGRAATTGAVSGMGSEVGKWTGEALAPEGYEGAAGFVGSLAGGGVGALATEVPRATTAAARGAGRVVRTSLGPMTESGAQRAAADRLQSSATDPMAARTALSANGEIVSGSRPTTFQQSGDMGLGSLEREMQTKFPAEFNQRRADQNAARLSQMERLQPNGDPAELPGYIKSQMRWLDQETDRDIANATRLAQERSAAVGGERTAEDYGSSLRGAMQEASDAARGRERALWQAVDPDGNLTIGASPVRNAAREIMDSVSGSAKPIAGDEAQIFRTAAAYGEAIPFRELTDLRSFVSESMRNELRMSGQTAAYARLSRLRGAIESGINSAVEQRAAQAPEQLQRGLSQFEQLQREAAEWTASRTGDRAYAAFGTGGVSANPGAQSSSRGQFGTSPGNPGVSSSPTFDDAAQERLNAATAATRERADTYGRGPVGSVLQKAGRQDQYRLSDATVPSRVFQPGAKGAESVQAFRAAVGDEQSFLILQDYAASDLRRAAGKLDGTLDPAKVTAWAQKHEPALRAFPQLQRRFESAAAASEAVAEAMAARRVALDAYQTGVFAKIIGATNPEDTARAIGGILNSQDRYAQMLQLATTARRNPHAIAGLRKGIADYIQTRFVGNTEAGTSGAGTIRADQFQTFIKQNEPALRHAFSAEEVKSLKDIAADLQRSNRSLAAVKIPGQSNTAQDLTQLAKNQPSVLGRLAVESAGALAGGTGATMAGASGPVGWAAAVAGWLGAKTVGALRDAGLRRTDDILREAMLNPELARALLQKVPTRPDTGSAARLAAALRKSALTGMAVGAANSSQPPATPSEPSKQPPVVQAPEVTNALAMPTQNALAAPQVGVMGNALMRAGAPSPSYNALMQPRGVGKAPLPTAITTLNKAMPKSQSGTSSNRTVTYARAR